MRWLLAPWLIAAPVGPVDPGLAEWYRSLRTPLGISCCDVSDCRPVEYRQNGENLEVFVDKKSFGDAAPDAWARVPPLTILRIPNPTGSAVACYVNGRVLCFVRGTEG